MRRLLLAVVVLVGVLTPVASAAPPACPSRTLVLAAMPLELNPLLEAAQVRDRVTHDGRTFYRGRLAGREVVLAMTGIGMVNAAETATAAFEHLGCFRAAVFSGVAGSKHYIGDVAVPRRWTDGKAWYPVAPGLFRAAQALHGTPRIGLTQAVPVGDAACLCPGVDAATPVRLWHAPHVRVGGDGTSGDTFGDEALPCLPGGGDVAGCAPCLEAGDPSFASDPPGPDFFRSLFQPPAETTDTFAAQDMETAAVARVAARHRVPFLGIRAVSDGLGDPLGLPGFPAQFFVYRQLAGDNAAATTIAFLRLRW